MAGGKRSDFTCRVFQTLRRKYIITKAAITPGLARIGGVATGSSLKLLLYLHLRQL